jgi:hypothetical protein
MKLLSSLAAAVVAAIAISSSAGAQAPMFPFVIPWDDSTHGVATDVSFLNDGAAGANGYIVAKNGHFAESKTGKRINFIGTNFAAGSAFPDHADAEKVAARIAKIGINIVRLHHMDNDDWGQAQSIWDYGFKDRQHISASQLDRLDYLISQLKKNGVYVNINLHVSRQFTEADGFPASVEKIDTSFDKRVDEFDDRMLTLQKKYANDLLTHVNPYTGLSYAQDPAVAVVEINNENSLVGDPWAGLGDGLDTLPEPFRGELKAKWNDWLIKKYGTDDRVTSAWTKGVTPRGPNLLSAQSQWSIEHQGTSLADFVPVEPGLHQEGAAPAMGVAINNIDGTDWHVQVHVTGLDLKEGSTYTVSFRAKADKGRTLPLQAGLDEADWGNVGLNANAVLGTDWKTFSYVFTAQNIHPNHNRIAFTLGTETGSVWIDDLQVHPGADGAGMSAGQSLKSKNVDIPVNALKAQHDDWVSFLADTERSYAEEMRGYLKNNLHVHANVICSQISWGGLTGVNRETLSDFADNHAYWQHPSFPHKAWDSVDWNIQNTPMVTDLANGGPGTLRDLAEYRIAGKPYSISEYNHPAPSDYRAEMVPELATFAALQDWDMIYLFDYGPYGADTQNDRINSYFGISSDPSKAAFLPAAAMIFRGGEFPKALGQKTVHLKPAQLGGVQATSVWNGALNGKAPNMFAQRLGLSVKTDTLGKSDPAYPADKVSPAATASPVRVLQSNAGAQYVALSASAQSVTGYVGGQSVTLGQNLLTFPVFGNNFAAVTITSMDKKPLIESRRLLVTLVGKVENQDMVWNAERTSVGNQWGHGPTVAEGIPATITITSKVAHNVWALDATGKRISKLPTTVSNGKITFTVGPQYQTLWYEVGR